MKTATPAGRLIRKYHTRDPFQLARMLGIHVKFIDTKQQKGFAKILLKNSFIFINRNMSEQMQRMACAHELGHLLLHRHLLTDRQWLLEMELFDIRSETEYEANVFAAELLIDEKELEELVRQGHDMISAASSLDVNVNLLMIRLLELQKKGHPIQVPFRPEQNFLGTIKDKADSI
ncbi:MAG: ImmA/IrrE family metallo-endopeptidase [Solobacterium sp.]|jgi:Zn-dependent peptidase ImmA (M78 family)|nr:ImmA/IrrE family metallo-endopeptidase [Solobacterium sp.]